MSLEQPGQAVQPRVQRSQWPWPLSVGVGTWRLFRVLLHVLLALAKSYTVWEGLSRDQRDAANRAWSGQLLRIMGLQLVVQGQARPGAKLVVSNHVSWLDIVAINAVVPSRFVSKAEVAHWPLIGRLVTYAGSLYLVRERRRDAMRVLGLMSQALKDGDTVAVFPEGTTGPGDHLLHFHPNLLQAAIDAEVPVQPVLIRYSDPLNDFSPSAAYVGDTTLMQSLWWVVSSKRVRINVTLLASQGARHADRRALATLLRAEMERHLGD